MFPYKGYTGKWLHVDLTTGEIEPRECDPTLAEDYTWHGHKVSLFRLVKQSLVE